MGCRCCKMLHSYLFDPVQVPSPGYVNEVSGCKLEEEDSAKFKGKPIGLGSAMPGQVQRTDLHRERERESARRTASRGRRPGPQGDTPAGKTAAAANGIGPAGDPGPPQEGTGPGASPAHSEPPTHPFPDRGDTDLPAPGEAPLLGNGGSGVSSSEAGRPGGDTPDRVPPMPAPDYPPPPRGAAAGGAGPAGKEEAAQRHPEEELQRRWGSLNGASGKEEDPAPPAAHERDGCGGALPEEEEDLEVAEALAALAAATAGEEDAEDEDAD